VEKFTIAIEPGDARHGTLAMAWGTFRWTVPIAVGSSPHPDGWRWRSGRPR
jgi:hypothetical protein